MPTDHTNRLTSETSPYLLQHAHNPVDWYPWGDDAIQRAREDDRPILLSVGYSACHWCHVMERESFENEAIAALMNREFVNVKVDREERPDVDAIYMRAVQMLTGQGGWPMTVFLTPDGAPFFGGTYFPPEDRYGHPGFPRVLQAVADAWKSRRAEIVNQAQEIGVELAEVGDFARGLPGALLTSGVLDSAYGALQRQYDGRNGGFGSAPKFPQPANLDFLLRCAHRTKQHEPLHMVEQTLQRMALGGIYDQLGGGFHRYSTDAMWLAPHFEKMLYDNAQLAQLYARCYQATGNDFYRGIAEATLDYVLREMTDPEGGFYSAQDADSEGEEGKFFVWAPDEVRAILGDRVAALFCAVYDVTARGNWEGKCILRVVRSIADAAAEAGMSEEEAAAHLANARTRLFDAREQRVKPFLDDKVLVSWNGLMLASLAECAAVFDAPKYLDAALRNARFIADRMIVTDSEGRVRLLHTYREGTSRVTGYLDDYAFYGDGLLRLYEATFDPSWLRLARALVDSLIALFWDETHGGFYATASDAEELIHRPKDWDDNATPSGNSVAVEVMLKLAVLTGEQSYRECAAKVLRAVGGAVEKHPAAFARMLAALDVYLSAPEEIAIIGDPEDGRTRELVRAVYRGYLSNKIVAGCSDPAQAPTDIPLLADRPLRGGAPTAYVCEGYACKQPVTSPAGLEVQLYGGA